jgi:hypothetical protein
MKFITMKKLFLTSLLLLGVTALSTSCQKKKLRTAIWYQLDRAYIKDPSPSIDVTYSSDMIDNHKIVRLSSQSDFLEFAIFLTHKPYQGQPLNNSQLMNLDYASNDLYIIAFDYTSQDWYELTGSSVKIDEFKQQVFIDFKIKTFVGGSGMGSFTAYLFVEIPKTYANYEIMGKMYLDEKSSSLLGSGAHDREIEYSLY